MIIDTNITAKIAFSANNAEYKNSGLQFISGGTRLSYKSNVQQNGIAIDTNLYLALKKPGYLCISMHQLNNI
jgi:hypothetical protein